MVNDLAQPISVSRISALAACPRQWAAIYLEGNRDPGNASSVVGTAFHEAIDWWERRRIFEATAPARVLDRLSSRTLADLAEVALTTQHDANELRVFGKKDIAHYMDLFEEWAQEYLEIRSSERDRGWRWFSLDPLSVEFHLHAELDSHPGVHGYLDQVLRDGSGRPVIRDIKSGKHHEWHYMQLEYYAWLFRVNYPDEQPPACQILYLPDDLRWYTPTMADEEVVREAMNASRQMWAIESVDGAPALGVFTGACGLCHVRIDCPVGQLGVNVEV